MRHYNFKLICFLQIVFLGSALGVPTKPADGDTLNYTHVLFQWKQASNAISYQLQVAIDDTTGGQDPFDSNLAIDLIDSTLLAIVTDSLEWNQAYTWRVRPILADDEPGDWTDPHTFVIATRPEVIPEMDVTMIDESGYQSGLTVFDIGGSGYTVAYDRFGKPVHFLSTGDPVTFPRFRAFNWLPNGNIIGAMNFGARHAGAWEMSLDGEEVWGMVEASGYELHNEFLKLPNGNYMGVSRHREDGPIPDGPWKAQFDTAGATVWPYLGDDIVEIDKNGSIVWSVNMFELYNMADYDSAMWYRAFSRGYYDWIHFNAIFYDAVEDMIYLSARSLSRITKLDHQTGQIVWNIGRNVFPNGISPDVSVGTDLNFSMQHAIEVLENRNLILYDNANQTGQISRAIEIQVTGTGPTDPAPTFEIVWEYTIPESLYTQSQGDADRLPNGNTLVTIANPTNDEYGGRIWEVDPDGNVVWILEAGSTTFFASERIPGLYAQAFSVIMPDFVPLIAEPTIFLPVGEATLEYRLFNEGWFDETYDYRLLDSDGWFDGEGSIAVASGASAVLEFPGTVVDLSYPNTIRLTVTPEQAPERADTLYLEAFSTTSKVDAQNRGIPDQYTLYPNYPNPFNPATSIRFDLPEATEVSLVIHDLLGREIARLVNGYRELGYHQATWDGRNSAGREVSSGIYMARLITPEYASSIKLVLLK